MSRKTLQQQIIKESGFILSAGTLDYQALLCKAYDLIVNFNIRTNLRKEIEKSLGNTKGESAERAYFYSELPECDLDVLSSLWNDDIFYLFEELSPNGFYFGTLEGDGACIGWFKA